VSGKPGARRYRAGPLASGSRSALPPAVLPRVDVPDVVDGEFTGASPASTIRPFDVFTSSRNSPSQ
jgi:hypothetical protein